MSGNEIRMTILVPDDGDQGGSGGGPWIVRIEGPGGSREMIFHTKAEARACEWAVDAYGFASEATIAVNNPMDFRGAS